MAPKKKLAVARRTKKASSTKAVAKSTTTRAPQAEEPNQTGFLDLPAEIRNEIYKMWARDVLHVGVRATGKAHTIAAHPVVNVSHLVHKEFCGVLGHVSAAVAQRIKVQIVDLDFYPLITYLKRVVDNPDADYRDFKIFGGRILIIELDYTDALWKDPPVENAAKWFRFLSQSVPGLEYELRTGKVADAAKTRAVLGSMVSGHDPNQVWTDIVRSFGEWDTEQQRPAMMQAMVASLMPQPKSAMEQAVDDYYNAIYAEADANDARRLAAEADGGVVTREEMKTEE